MQRGQKANDRRRDARQTQSKDSWLYACMRARVCVRARNSIQRRIALVYFFHECSKSRFKRTSEFMPLSIIIVHSTARWSWLIAISHAINRIGTHWHPSTDQTSLDQHWLPTREKTALRADMNHKFRNSFD